MTGIRHLHSFIAYLFLFSLIFVVLSAVYGRYKNKAYTMSQWKITKLLFVFSHIQLLLGIGLWTTGGYMNGLFEKTSLIMKDSSSRLSSLEHPMINIIAIIIISLGYFKLKKASENDNKNQITMSYFIGALILILSRIPWKTWLSL